MAESQINVIRPKRGFNLPKLSPVVVIISTLVLAVVAVVTAYLLYQSRNQPVAPTAPASQPRADEEETPPPATPQVNVCTTSFTISPTPTPSPSPSPTPTPTPTATPSPTPTPTPTPVGSCGNTCTQNSDCQSSMICFSGVCRNPACTGENDCVCSSPTPTPTPPTTASGPTPTPVMLEQAGSVAGTWTVSVVGAALVILGSVLVFAL